MQNDYFYIACAKNERDLAAYFLREDVEYRWLLDEQFALNNQSFHVTSVKINQIELEHAISVQQGCLEIRCFHPYLKKLVGSEVVFTISTKTFYPKKSHQLTVFINEMTRGLQIEFEYDEVLKKVEVVPIFSGRTKFPNVEEIQGKITVFSQEKEWIMPNSGVVFVY